MWVDFCLFEGKVRVVIDGWSSDQLSINAGVPQGLVSSATLFLLHINTLLNPGFIGYADYRTVAENYKSDA